MTHWLTADADLAQRHGMAASKRWLKPRRVHQIARRVPPSRDAIVAGSVCVCWKLGGELAFL